MCPGWRSAWSTGTASSTSGGSAYAAWAGRRQVDPDTVFQLASVSKPLASTVVAGAVGDKAVSWDDPVRTHDPGFALKSPWVSSHVTLADLFAHRSGLPDHAGDLLEDLHFDRPYILRHLRYEPLAPFRASYAYTNFGLTEAALAAARAEGTTWEDLSAACSTARSGCVPPARGSPTTRGPPTRRSGTSRPVGCGAQDTYATPTRSLPQAGPARRCGTWRSGCACSSANGRLGGKRVIDEQRPAADAPAAHRLQSAAGTRRAHRLLRARLERRL